VNCLTRLALLSLALLAAGQALAQQVVILYPLVREPYAGIYRDTLAGIEQTYTGESRALPVRPGAPLAPGLFAEDGPGVAVALGNGPARALAALRPSVPVITTATADIPFKVRHRLAYYPDPPLLLEQLRRFQPKLRRVKLVAAPEIGAYTERVREVLGAAGLGLDVCPAGDLKAAADCYRALLDQAAANEAIWILEGGRLLEPALLSYILDAAWRRQLLVFSSNPAHAGRGALFALYPDNQAAGRQIGTLIEECLRQCGGDPSRESYLRQMKVVLNERTSRHLGLDIAPEARQGVDLVL
jgi:putative tryptophan/tyrosine transport system substrate-binding protein